VFDRIAKICYSVLLFKNRRRFIMRDIISIIGDDLRQSCQESRHGWYFVFTRDLGPSLEPEGDPLGKTEFSVSLDASNEKEAIEEARKIWEEKGKPEDPCVVCKIRIPLK
jgi:hypothetical protein